MKSRFQTCFALLAACAVLCLTSCCSHCCHDGCKEERKAIRSLAPEQLVICVKNADDRALADDLALHFKLMTGREVAVNPAKLPDNAYPFMLGSVPEMAANKPLKPEEGCWLFTDKAAYFYGEGKYGLKHAVYYFLENELGVRWPTGTEIVVKNMPSIPVYTESFSWVPVIRAREIRPGNGIGSSTMYKLWQDRLLWGMHDVPPFGHAFTGWWERYGKTHPEYFALNDGRRFPVGRDGKFHDDIAASLDSDAHIISLCPSNPAVADQIVKNWGGRSPYINICENDGAAAQACHCENCIALDPKHSQELSNDMGADRYILLATRVLEKARKIKPDVKVSFYAYNASEQPPQNIKMQPGMVLGIVPTDFRMSSLTDFVDRWKAAGMTEFKYRPNRHHYYTPVGFPLGSEKHFFDVFQYMYKAGATNFDYDAPAKYDIVRWHADYILQHAMSAPEKPFCHWERHFAEAYAGPAAPELMEYFKYWRVIWDKKIHPALGELANRANYGYFAKAFVCRVSEYYTAEDFVATGRMLDAALAKNLDEGQRRRMEELKLFHDHAAIMLKAHATKNYDDVVAVRNFRAAHGMPKMMQYEYDLSDFLGIRIDELESYVKPFTHLPTFWHFKLDPKDVGEKEGWFASRDFASWDGLMPIDGPWENPKAGRPYPSAELKAKTDAYNGIAWYALELEVPREWQGKRQVFIYFGAVDEGADIWCNGKKAGSHPFVQASDWETPFDMEITDQIDWSKPRQVIVVKVTDRVGAGGIWKGAVLGSKLIKK